MRRPQKFGVYHVIAMVFLCWADMGLAAADAPQVDSGHSDHSNPPSVHRIIWDKTPIPITLTVGVEQLVSFENEIRVGMPTAIQPVLRTQSVDGTIYWRAEERFEVQRIQVQNVKTGEIVLIDLKALEQDATLTPIPIEVVAQRDATISNPESTTPSTSGFDYVTLTRFAAQQLYAPKRLLTQPEGIYRAPLPRGSAPLIRGLSIESVPIAAWRAGLFHITAVRLRNLAPKPVTLDPRTLRGSWRAATFQHARLFPAGDEADTTTVYLISTQPFEQSF